MPDRADHVQLTACLNGIVERFNGTVRQESDDDYGENYLKAEATIAGLMRHYNEERLHAALGYISRVNQGGMHASIKMTRDHAASGSCGC